VAIEPLPQLEDFLPQWRALLKKEVEEDRQHDWDRAQDRWLREAVERLEGSDGLAKIARSTKRADDLRAWCRSLVEAKDWKAALVAFHVSDKEYARGEFLDGAALSAQELGRRDLPSLLERAWRTDTNLVRLRRWLGTTRTRANLKKRAKKALAACPNEAHRQRAFLHVLLGEYEPAAKLLAAAPGLGWSRGEHPGHLLIAVFRKMLSREIQHLSTATGVYASRWMDSITQESLRTSWGEARLVTPELDQILELSGVDERLDPEIRRTVVEAMREAAEKRLEGVTDKKRRRYYDHAAWLVGICMEVDPSPETSSWVTGIRSEYRRYPALKRELEKHLGRS